MFCSGEEARLTGTCLIRKPQEIRRALAPFSLKKKKSVLLEVEGDAKHAMHSITRRATRSNIAGKIPYAPRPNGTAWLLCSHQASSVPRRRMQTTCWEQCLGAPMPELCEVLIGPSETCQGPNTATVLSHLEMFSDKV